MGHAPALLRDPMGFLLRMRGLGGLVEIRLGGKSALVVNDPRLIRQVLVDDARKYDKGSLFEKAATLLGNGLATSSGDFHQRQRRLIQPAFHRSRFPKYLEIMNEVARSKAASWQSGTCVDVLREMHEVAFRASARTLFTTRATDATVAELDALLTQFTKQLRWRTFSPFPVLERLPLPVNRRFHATAQRMRSLVFAMIEDYRREGVDRGDLMSFLLSTPHADTGVPMSDEAAYDEAITLMGAATETTAAALGWLFHHLGENPQVRERLCAELDSVLGGRPVQPADLPRLSYSRQVLDEVLRLHPLTLLPRRALGPVELAGTSYPEGTQMFISPHALHHDARCFDDPHTFDPDRWAPEAASGKEGAHRQHDNRHYLPFGTGIRRCVGDNFALAEMITVVAAVSHQWRLAPLPGSVVKEKMEGATSPDRLRMTVARRTPTPGTAGKGAASEAGNDR